MVKYILRFTKCADEQLNTIYTDKRVFINDYQFSEQFKEWNYELLQYLRPNAFIGAKYKGAMSLGRIGELYYNIYEVSGTYVVVIEKFFFSYLPFVKSSIRSKGRFIKIKDAGYGYSIIQDNRTQKYSVRKPNKKPLTKFVFDSIIGFYHSTEDYNKIHAIGFIGDRVYEILMNGNIDLLHMSKDDYLSMRHQYDETFRRKLNIIIENTMRKYIPNKVANKSLKRKPLNENRKAILHSKIKSLIRLTEGDLCHIVKNCINEVLLIENRESKSIKQTEKIIVSLFQNRYGNSLFQTVKDVQGQPILTQRGDEQTMLQYLERHVRATFFHNDYANIKFEPGIARIAYGELGMQANEDQQSLHELGGILKILSQAHSDEYDSNLNGMSFTDLDNRFGESVSEMGKEEQDRINNAEYNDNGDYTIVRINTFEEAKPFYKYTNPQSRWCLTHMKNMFDRYTNNGSNTLYFAYKNGFENIEPIEGEGCPLDEYGLSLLSIIMAPDYGDGSSLAYCTCRWNHGNGGSDSVMDAQELSNVLGSSVFKLCPSRKIEINIDGDLGLPSGTIWMTKNVGAKSETDYGKYFAWGMKEGFNANEIGGDMFSDEWYKQQEIVDWTNFRFEDGSYAPSKEQLNELKENCTYNFIKYKGVNGGLFTSKINGNSIFVPAAGYCCDGSQGYVGEYGNLWRSSLDESYPLSAWNLLFNSGGVDLYIDVRCYGLSVRGVVSPSK